MDPEFNSPDLQDQIMEQERAKCNLGLIHATGWCPETWDSVSCWPSTAPGATATIPCPRHVAGFLPANATKQCMPTGNWYWNPERNITWSNYTQCYKQDKMVTVLMEVPEKTDNVTYIEAIGSLFNDNLNVLGENSPESNSANFPVTILSWDATRVRWLYRTGPRHVDYTYVDLIKHVSLVGYAVSLTALIIAFCILISIKKLRCPRNVLHMHLFASFMTRAFMALMKHTLFVDGLGLRGSDVVFRGEESYWINTQDESNWQCKAFTSIWQYSILANYSWILMEGLYLHNLVFLALFTDSNSSIAGYVILGWGLPALFVLPWVAVRAALEDTLCWTTNKNPLLFLIIRVPTMLSILINFVLFINIVRVLLSKLKSTVSEETQRYKRWARSTLILVPLFGVHYTVFLGMSYRLGVNDTVEKIWLFCDQLFASFQGFFVAVLYCFLNGEVRAEVSRAWRGRKWPRYGSGRWGARSSTRSCSTCSCNAVKVNKQLKTKGWWSEPRSCCWRQEDTNRSLNSMASTQDVGNHGGSLTSSRGYLEVIGTGGANQTRITHTSPLCSKYTDQSLLSFCSNMSEVSVCGVGNLPEKSDNIPEQHRWSDSECCHLAYELHSLQRHAHP